MRAAKRKAVSNSTLRLATLMPLTPSENHPPEFFPTVTLKVTGSRLSVVAFGKS
jgi:hypothetical protein